MSRPRRLRSSRKSGNYTWLLVGILLGLLLAAGYWWISLPPAGLGAIARVIPASAEVVVSLQADWQKWQSLSDRLGAETAKAWLNSSPIQAVLAQSKTDLLQDIKPWLGSHGVMALVSDPQNPNNPPGTLLLMPTRDPGKSDQFLQKYRANLTAQGAIFSGQTYRGVEFSQSPGANPAESLITLSLDRKLVALSNSRNLIQQVIDSSRSERPALSDQTKFRHLLAESDALVKVYLDGAIAWQFLGDPASDKLESLSLDLKLEDQSLRFQLDSHLLNQQFSLNTSQRLLDYLPANTVALVSGSNLQQSWQSIRDRTKNNSTTVNLINQWQAAVKQTLALDWEKEILAWSQGEFAIAAIKHDQGVLQTPGLGLAVLSRTSDPEATTKFLEKLSEVAQSGLIPFVPQGVEIKTDSGKSTTSWQVNSQSSSTQLASQGFLQPDLAFWAMGTLGQSLGSQPSVIQTSTFQNLTRAFVQPSSGYFYLDLALLRQVLTQAAPPELKSRDTYMQTMALLERSLGIVVSLVSPDPQTLRLDGVVSLLAK
ncbi:MAG: DUF3352 domain-containing protein [Pseudanabaenaceae cyanobacterium bins.68]|nr:DUF3352 domain-containing protein [Pseudanabaenaceae cyanobacterium bins.68]